MRASRENPTVARVCASISLRCSVVSTVEIVKLPAHRAGLPGKEISFLIVPLDPLCLSTHWASRPIGPLNPAYKAWLAGHLLVIKTVSSNYRIVRVHFI
jgi:hypothetical protein